MNNSTKNIGTSAAAFSICLVLVVLVCIVFGQVISFDFVNFDDGSYVYANPQISNGITLDGIKWILTHPHSANWHPLTSFSHMLDCQIYELNPFGPHLTNLLLHNAVVLAFFFVLRAMTGSVWRSAVTAALFAIHPLRAESVAWVSERKDLLSGLFFMVTLCAYLRYTRRPFSLLRYSSVAALFIAGLLSKSMLVTLPFVLLLLDFWPLERFRSEKPTRLILEKVPLIIISALFCGVTVWAQRDAIASTEALPFGWRVENAAVSYLVYIKQLIVPSGLAALYPVREGLFPVWQIVGAVVFLVAITGIVLRKIKTCPALFTGWFWYLGMLIPVVGILQVGSQAHADRYTYLPQIGLVMAVVWLIGDWADSRRRRIAASVVSAALLCVLTIAGRAQTGMWKNGTALWTRTLAHTENNPVAHSNFGALLLVEGDPDGAIEQFEKSIQLNAGRAEVFNNLAAAYAEKGRYAEAVRAAEIALALAEKRCDPAIIEAIRARREEYRSNLPR
ncbi:MAG: tetratricopeptide repeat protein [Kiritimatiellales bacterium]|nr:tetratricopeptide repeat protein [Kiritimatiellota bacterium]MBL7016647.1 tetratricopeptide repeat protein [Kiritimatiellales bacterium]